MALQKPLPNWLLYKRNLFYEDIAEKKRSSQTFPRHPEAAAIPDPAGKVHRCSSLRRKFIKGKKNWQAEVLDPACQAVHS